MTPSVANRVAFAPERTAAVARALMLAYLTVSWNLAEGTIAVWAALAADSVALLGFGIDSFVESASAGIIIWRLRAERRAANRIAIERLDRRAHKFVGVSLFGLALYIACDATIALWLREKPGTSLVGVVLAVASIGVMLWLARSKRKSAAALGSRALTADAFQTTACWWISIITLCGTGLNAMFGWWWADPTAALGMVVFLVREGREAWRSESCCD